MWLVFSFNYQYIVNRKKVFNFGEFQLINFFSFIVCSFCVMSKKYLSNPKTQRFSTCSSKTFIALFYIFISIFHVDLNYAVRAKSWDSLFFISIFHRSSTICFKIILFPLNYFGICVKNQLSLHVWIYFQMLCPVLLICLSLQLTLLYYCNYIGSLDIHYSA